VPAPDRRTIGELLADSDALARETLLDATPENGPAMVRSLNQLVASAAHLWAALSTTPDHMSESDPMERLGVVGEAIARSVRAGHRPGHGPTDDHVSEIADNLSRARHLIERDGRPSGPATADRLADTPDIHGQVMHTLYVAAHGTAVALGAYVTELQHRLEVGTRRRQQMAERPTALEITEAQGMITRFGGFGSSPRRACSGSHSLPRTLASEERRPRQRGWKQHWLPGRFKRTAHWPPIRIQPTWCESPACRHSSPAPQASSPMPPPEEAISTTM
jgi:hypothetical protein